MLRILRETTPEARDAIGARLRERLLARHTAGRRADELGAVAA